MTYCRICGQSDAHWAGCPGGDRIEAADNLRRLPPRTAQLPRGVVALSTVAEIYDAAEQDQRATGLRAVMARFGVGYQSAQQWVREARARGLVA